MLTCVCKYSLQLFAGLIKLNFEEFLRSVTLLLFTHHYPARCFGINMPKSRDIQAKIPLPQAIWNEFWLRY